MMAMVIGLMLASTNPARAQDVFIPNFWDAHERFVKPDLASLPRLKFLTTTDFPPFNFIDRKKRLSGFHIDLAGYLNPQVCRKCTIASQKQAFCDAIDLTPARRKRQAGRDTDRQG